MSVVLKALTFSQAFFLFPKSLFCRIFAISQTLSVSFANSSSSLQSIRLLQVSALGCLVVFPSHLFHLTSPFLSTPKPISCLPKVWLHIHSTNIHWINILVSFFSLTPTFQPSNFVGSTIKIYLEADLLLLLPTRLKAPSSPGPLH